MVDSIETCRDYMITIPLSTLKFSKLCDFSSRFYESLNGKNRMCELCTFSQIRSHIMLNILLEVAVLCSKFSTDSSIRENRFNILSVIDCSSRVSRSFAICFVAKPNIWEGLPDI